MSLKRITARLGLGTSIVLMAALVGGIGAIAVAGSSDRVKADPSDEIVHGQFVKVSWREFPSSGLVYLRQCIEDPESADDCLPGLVNGISRADGTGTEYFKAFRRDIPGDQTQVRLQEPVHPWRFRRSLRHLDRVLR